MTFAETFKNALWMHMPSGYFVWIICEKIADRNQPIQGQKPEDATGFGQVVGQDNVPARLATSNFDWKRAMGIVWHARKIVNSQKNFEVSSWEGVERFLVLDVAWFVAGAMWEIVEHDQDDRTKETLRNVSGCVGLLGVSMDMIAYNDLGPSMILHDTARAIGSMRLGKCAASYLRKFLLESWFRRAPRGGPNAMETSGHSPVKCIDEKKGSEQKSVKENYTKCKTMGQQETYNTARYITTIDRVLQNRQNKKDSRPMPKPDDGRHQPILKSNREGKGQAVNAKRNSSGFVEVEIDNKTVRIEEKELEIALTEVSDLFEEILKGQLSKSRKGTMTSERKCLECPEL